MAIDFPANPTVNQVFVSGGTSWTWDGVKWTSLNAISIATVSATPPSLPQPGSLWFDTVGAQLYVYFNDGTSSQWVAASNPPGGLNDAASDGQTYGRMNAAWSPALPLSGGTLTGPLKAPLIGVTDGSNAAAGQIGEFLSASLAGGSAITLTTNVTASPVSLSLTAGDWDVSGVVQFSPTAAIPAGSYLGAALGLTIASPGVPDGTYQVANASVSTSVPTPIDRFSFTATTTVHLNAYANFASGSLTAFGQIRARRVR